MHIEQQLWSATVAFGRVQEGWLVGHTPGGANGRDSTAQPFQRWGDLLSLRLKGSLFTLGACRYYFKQ